MSISRGEISYSTTTIAEIDPHVAASPRGVVAASWMGVSRIEGKGVAARVIGSRVSEDNGATWHSIDEHHTPGERFATDSMLAALPDNTFALTWLGFHANLERGGGPYDLGVYMARVNAPNMWPVEVTADVPRSTDKRGRAIAMRFDKPWTAVTSSGTTVTSYRFESLAGAGIQVSRSKDGVHFEHTVVDSAASFGGTLATICADPNGARVVVAYPDALGRATPRIVARWSDDGGATFPLENTWIVTNDAPAVVEAPFCAVHGDTMVVIFGIGSRALDDGANALIDALLIVRSRNGAREKTIRAIYNDEANVILHPAISELPSGDFDIVYAAGKDAGDEQASIKLVTLAPVGAVRTPPRVLRSPITLVTKRNPELGWTGDLQGVASVRSDLGFAALGDNSGALPHVLFQKVR